MRSILNYGRCFVRSHLYNLRHPIRRLRQSVQAVLWLLDMAPFPEHTLAEKELALDTLWATCMLSHDLWGLDLPWAGKLYNVVCNQLDERLSLRAYVRKCIEEFEQE